MLLLHPPLPPLPGLQHPQPIGYVPGSLDQNLLGTYVRLLLHVRMNTCANANSIYIRKFLFDNSLVITGRVSLRAHLRVLRA